MLELWIGIAIGLAAGALAHKYVMEYRLLDEADKEPGNFLLAPSGMLKVREHRIIVMYEDSYKMLWRKVNER